MKLAVVVPVKPAGEAKSRLATVLSPAARAELARELYDHTLTTIERWGKADWRLVVSRDARVLASAGTRGWVAVTEETADLNGALTQAGTQAMYLGADSLLILPADLPLLAPEDLDALVALATNNAGMVIAPCRRGTGTNALLLRPPDVIPLTFGPESFVAHRRLATQRGVTICVCRSPALALDLDTPEDWRTFRAANRSEPFPI